LPLDIHCKNYSPDMCDNIFILCLHCPRYEKVNK
jgi:hypothetical protein